MSYDDDKHIWYDADNDNEEGYSIDLDRYDEMVLCRNNDGFFELESSDGAPSPDHRPWQQKDQPMDSFAPLESWQSSDERIDCEGPGLTVIVIHGGEIWCSQSRLA